MKKALLSLVLLVVVAGLGSYYYMGMLAETELNKEISQLNVALAEQATQPAKMTVSLANYQRGLFSSTADLEFKMKVDMPQGANRPKMRMPRMGYTLKLDIDHGPFIIKSQKLGLAEAHAVVSVPEQARGMAKMMLEDRSTLPELSLSMFLNFGGNGHLSMNLPAFSLFPKTKQGEAEWKGFEAVYHFDKDLKKVNGHAVVKGFDFKNMDNSGHFGEMRMNYDMSYSPFGFWLGKATLNLASIDVMTAGKNVFTLTDFSMGSGANITSKLLNTDVNSSIKLVKVRDESFGPGDLKISFNGLDASVFKTLQEKVQSLNNPAYSPTQRQDMMMKLLPLASELLNKGAVFALDNLSLKMPMGQLKANAKLSLKKGVKITKPEDLADNVHAVAHLTIPKVLLKEMLMDKARAAVIREQMQADSKKQASQADSVASDTSDADTHTSSIEHGDEAKQLADKENAEINTTDTGSSDKLDIRQRAEEKVNSQLSKLVTEKVLIEAGDAYKIDVMYEKGQFKVNGKNFLPDQLQL